MIEQIKIIIVDDQMLFREALNTLLSTRSELLVVGEAGNGQEAINLVHDVHPDVVLMDLRMPIMSGAIATRQLLESYPELKVIILTTFDDTDDVIDGLKAGAVGYLMKDVSSEKLVEAIQAAYRGEYFLLPSITAKVVGELARLPQISRYGQADQKLAEELSPREMEILHLVAKGNSNREIARDLVITEGTVKNHLSSILGKLSVRDRIQAVVRARELRIID